MNTDLEHIVAQLRRVGLRPSDRQWELVREAGMRAIEPLLALALDVDRLAESEPAALGPVHALRLLGELPAPAPEQIDGLLRALPPDGNLGGQAAFIWWQELPQIVAHWGRAGLEAAKTVLQDEQAGAEPRAVAAETLGYVAEFDTDLKAETVALLREQLRTEQDAYVSAHIVEALGNLRAWKAYEDVMAAYKRGAVDKETISAAEARQQILSDKPHPIAGCLRHTLAERYQRHGPYSEEQRQAMAAQQRGLH
jgi:hypothetical protein